MFNNYDAIMAFALDADTCPRCQIGNLHLTSYPFLHVFRGHVFVIPEAPRYVCDVCQYDRFDDTVFERINQMIAAAAPAITVEITSQPDVISLTHDDDHPITEQVPPEDVSANGLSPV